MEARHSPPGRVWLCLAVALAMLAAACGPRGVDGGPSPATDLTAEVDRPQHDPIKLGMATTLSGATALFSDANRKGAQLAVDELNRAGGVLGRPVQLIIEDDEGQPDVAADVARDLIDSHGVSALLGPVSSAVAMAVTDVAEDEQVPLILHTSNNEALTVEAFHRYVVSVAPSTGMEARAQAIDLSGRDITRWATIAPNYEFGQRQTDTFVETLRDEAPHVEIVAQQWPPLNEPRFEPFITALLSANPEAVYSSLFGSDLVTFSGQAASMRLFDEVLVTALYDTSVLRELGDRHDLSQVRAYSRCPFRIETAQMQDFVRTFEQRYGEVPSDWACTAYDAVTLWADVVEEVGDLNADAFARTVAGFSFASLRGQVEVRAIDHQAAVPSYAADLELDEQRGFYVHTNITEIPAEDIWLSEAEIREKRGGG
ncbi:MAG: ABC transporter substrate-binding protein [Actinomycetota bacterium]|nr:ABC transporter substrate-binding protein [Actinomycetota bacterium]